jgi:ABC-type phosphate/phosphonate transport system substrate-binding protein
MIEKSLQTAGKIKYFGKAIVIVCFFMSGAVSFLFTSLGRAEPDKVLRMANLANTISGVAKKDAKLAVVLLLRKVRKEKLPEYRLENSILADVDSVVQNFNAGKIDVLTISSIDYLKIRRLVNIEPAFVSLRDGKPENDYVLLVNKDKGIKTLEQLQNKKISIEKGMNGEAAVLWLETMLLDHALPESSLFMQKFKRVDKVSQAVLPVFFGQADACIVHRYKFETLSALNSQIGKKLQAIYASPPLLNQLTCFRKDLDEHVKEAALSYTERLQSDPEGRQFLMMYRIEGTTKYKNEYITAIENLYEKFKTLNAKAGAKE